MRNLIIIVVIASIGWYIQNTYDFSGVKEKALDAMSKEKTINAVNVKRANDQADVNDVINNNVLNSTLSLVFKNLSGMKLSDLVLLNNQNQIDFLDLLFIASVIIAYMNYVQNTQLITEVKDINKKLGKQYEKDFRFSKTV